MSPKLNTAMDPEITLALWTLLLISIDLLIVNIRLRCSRLYLGARSWLLRFKEMHSRNGIVIVLLIGILTAKPRREITWMISLEYTTFSSERQLVFAAVEHIRGERGKRIVYSGLGDFGIPLLASLTA